MTIRALQPKFNFCDCTMNWFYGTVRLLLNCPLKGEEVILEKNSYSEVIKFFGEVTCR